MITTPEPFLILEAEIAPRLEPEPLLVPPAEPAGWLRSPALAGTAVLGLGIPLFATAWLVTGLFDRSETLGWTGLAVLLTGLGLVTLGIARELRALAALRRVDHLRAALSTNDTQTVQKAARQWLHTLPQHAALLPALTASDTPEGVRALLRAGPLQSLRESTDALGRTAALQSVASVAATPSPALDVLAVGWCGLRLIRQVADLHGMRPGTLATLALLRKTALAAATVAVTEVAVNAATHAMIAHPLLRHLAGDVAGAGVAARRMMVLARAAAAACSPLSRA